MHCECGLFEVLAQHGVDADIDLNAHDPAEFNAFRWIEPARLPDLIIPFKRPVYEAVLEMFGPHL